MTYFWRLPQKPRRPRPAPPSSRRPATPPPSSRPPAPAAPIVPFEARQVGDRFVLVSAEAARFCPADLAQALVQHGPLSGNRESKHRSRSGTLMVVSSAAKGEVLVATVSEMRAMRRGLGTSERSNQRRRRGR